MFYTSCRYFLARFCVLIRSSLWWPQKHSQSSNFQHFSGRPCPPPLFLCCVLDTQPTTHYVRSNLHSVYPLFHLWIRHCIPMHRRVVASGMMKSYIMHLYRNMVLQSCWKISVLYHLVAATVDNTAMYGATCLCLSCFKYSVLCMLPLAASQYKNVPMLFTY